MKKLITTLIIFYQLLSPFPGVCRFQPTCSEYTKQAINRFGMFHGILLGLKRVSRCRPGNGPELDPLP